MGLQIIQGTTGYLQPALASLTTGWTLSGGWANHDSCNPGNINAINNYGLIVGRQYTVTYTVKNYVSGNVHVFLGNGAGASRSANGTYTETITCTTAAVIGFYSNGTLTVGALSFYDTAAGVVKGGTISFHPKSNQWGSEYSYQQEVYIKFGDNFLSLKNGGLWLHNANPVMNNFNGVQYQSQVQLIPNLNPAEVKMWFTMRVQSNRTWFCPNYGDINIEPTADRPLGMTSRLTANRFNNYQGSYFADFLMNSADPRIGGGSLSALFNGEPLRGRYMSVLLTCIDTVPVTLFEVDFKSSPSAYTY